MMRFQFKGNWLVNYDPDELKFSEILITLAKIQDHFNENRINFNSININFNKNGAKNYYFNENGDIFLSFCGFKTEFEERNTKPCKPAFFKSLEPPIKTISLLFPRLENDPRWKTIGLPAGQLFLASNLRANGFAVFPQAIVLKGRNQPPGAFKSDLTGFSLFEDLLPLLRPFLADFRLSYKGIVAAGGPFPTLAPLAAIFHLPQVNLFVRGEAEMVLPQVIQGLNQGDSQAFFSQKGVFWQQPGLIAMAGFDQVNRPEDFSAFQVDLSFLQAGHVEHGLEMNFSRGCGRGCVFCCRAQGRKLRELPLEKAEELLKEYRKKVESLNEASDRTRLGLMNQTPTNGISWKSQEGYRPSPTIERINGRDDRAPTLPCHTLNINDDDILQDPAYAGKIFGLIKKYGFRIFGIQTSTASLINSDGSPNHKVLDLIAEPEMYFEGRPLLWLGTDTFLLARARRLGKKLPPIAKFRELLEELERRKLRHFHYWISSDGDSTWEEFVDELAFIFGFFRDFPGFGLLAHAPFIVPYPASLLFGRLPTGDPKLQLKLELAAPDPRFSYKVVDRLETRWPQLNNLLRNEKAGGEKGFFDFLKEKDFLAAAQLAYHFLKQEMLQNATTDRNLLKAREMFEKLIPELLELSNR